MAKKKYKPRKEVMNITGTMIGVSVGTNLVGTIGGTSSHTPSSMYSAMGMMGTIPLVQTGGSVLRSLEVLEPKRKKRK